MGLKKATQEYIAFLDADDVWDSYKTEKQMDYFIKNNKIDFLACCRNNESLTFPYQTLPNSKLAIVSLKKLLIKHICATPTVIIKRKTIQEVGWFNKNMRYAEDANYWLRISENHKMYILNESLVTTGEGKNSFGVSGLSANLKEMEKGFEYNLKELYKAKRLNTIEYFLFFMIEKLKYFSRPIRLMLKQNI